MRGGERGLLVIIAAPSGGGKTTLIRHVMGLLEADGRQSHFAVSHTTRPLRGGEVDGRDYHFVSDSSFRAMVEAGEFLEYAEVHGRYYGTARREVEGRLEQGCDVFLDIDVQGARQVKEAHPDSVLVFVFPPSYEEVRRRLLARGEDLPEQISIRMRNALNEMQEFSWFDCVIINDRLDEAVREFKAVLTAARLRPAGQAARAAAIIADFRRHLEEE